jgi:hypothetical protein
LVRRLLAKTSGRRAGSGVKFSILHSSARPDKWRTVYDAWIAAADNPPDVQYVLVVDRRWGFEELPDFVRAYGGIPTKHEDLAIWNTGRRCYVDGVNIAAAYATGDIFIVIADDQFPCEHWDTEIEKAITQWHTPGVDIGGDYCVVVEVSTQTPAEHDRKILVMPILSRGRYKKYGYVLYPAYESMYADNDFREMADRDGAVYDARHLVFPHKHPIFDQSQLWDSAYQAQNRPEAYQLGQAVLEKRRESNFGDVRVIEREPQARKPSILLMLPGETFNQAYLKAFFEIITSLTGPFEINAQFSFSSNVYITRKYMLDTARSWDKRPEYILWIDDDQVLTLQGLQHLISDLEQNPELAGVAGWAWCEQNIYGGTPMLSFGIETDEGSRRMEYELMQVHPSDLIPISYSGFPAVLMRGSILDTMTGDDFLPIFDKDLFKPWGMSGEDAAFFSRANDKRLKFAVDRRVKVPHLKLRCAEPVIGSSLEGAPVPVERTQ